MRIRRSAIATTALVVFVVLLGCQASFNSNPGSDSSSPMVTAMSTVTTSPLALPAAGGAPSTTTAATSPSGAAAESGTMGDQASTATLQAGGTFGVRTSATPMARTRIKMVGVKIQVPGNLVFETGKATLDPSPGNEAILEELREFLEQNPKVTQMRIEGHTDNVGKADANLELSGQRALTIKKWLTGKGISQERLIAAGFGDTRPLTDNADATGRAQNRRTEFKIAGWEGTHYLGRDPLGGGQEF